MAIKDMDGWLRAATEAVEDFVAYGLANEIGEIHGLRPTDNDEHIVGSQLTLSCGSDKVEIGLLANKNTLSNLARAMLDLTPDVSIDSDQIKDATKEIINIISGGVKARMHAEVADEILLGLPLFLDESAAKAKEKLTFVAKVVIAGQPAELYAQQTN